MISWNFLAFLAGSVIEFHNHDAYRILTKDFQAFRVGLLRRRTSAEFVFLFMVSNTYVLKVLILMTLKAKICRTYDF